MTRITNTKSKCRPSAQLAAGLVISAALALGMFAASAGAEEHRGDYHHAWNGRYYQAPPVVYGGYYGSPYYAPPVVYGPAIGISLPFVNIGIR